jgi:predicted transcriptional regulator
VTQIGDRTIIATNARRAEAILLVLSGCTLTEVGKRFGISRERIRQYVRDAGLNVSARVRFHDTQIQAERHMKFTARARRRRARKQRIREHMARAVAWLRAYADANGATPIYQQLADALGLNCTKNDVSVNLASYFGRRWREQSRQSTRRIHLVYRLAGLTVRALGAPGHRDGGASASQASGVRMKRWWQTATPEQLAHRLAAYRATRGWAA